MAGGDDGGVTPDDLLHPEFEAFDDQGVPDRNLQDVRDGQELGQVLQVEVVAGIDAQAGGPGGRQAEVLEDGV